MLEFYGKEQGCFFCVFLRAGGGGGGGGRWVVAGGGIW